MCEPMISRLIFKLDASLGPEKIGEIDSCGKYPFEVRMIFHLLTLSLLFEKPQNFKVVCHCIFEVGTDQTAPYGAV